MDPIISVIIPIFNTSSYLERCLDSVRNQRMADFEVILVDDGSTDGSGEMADEYSRNDSRFRVFHKANGGASSARNLGLSHVRGGWVTFIDSDDYVLDTYLSDLYDEALASDADIIVSGLQYFYNGQKQFRTYPDARLSGESLKELFTKYKAHISANVHQKLYRRRIVENLRFNENIHNHEDYIFCCECFMKIDSISLTSKINYMYEMRDESLSRWINTPEREFVYCSAVCDQHRRLVDRFGPEIARELPLTKFVKEYLYSLCHFEKGLLRRMKALSRLPYKAKEIYPEYSRPTAKDRIYLYAIAHRIYPLLFYITDVAIAKSSFKFVNRP